MDEKLNMSDFFKEHIEASMDKAIASERYPIWIRECSELSDVKFIYMGLLRCLTPVDSGRHFIQNSSQQLELDCPHSTYFKSLYSSRRTGMLKAVSDASYSSLCSYADKAGIDYLSNFPELDGYTVEAADGHFITHACHTPENDKGKVFAAGFIYAMNMRNGFLIPICKVTNGTVKSHEIPCFKEWVEKKYSNNLSGNKLYIYDRAAVDYQWWDKQKKKNIFMISILKENAVTEFVTSLDFDKDDVINTGIAGYELHSKKGKLFTVTTYKDPETNKIFKFVSTLPVTFRPGLIALLYYKRWTIEKAFNNSKSDLKEKKAWTSDNSGLKSQMILTAMSYNLVRLLEEMSKKSDESLIHPAEIKYEKSLNDRQVKANLSNKFVNPVHFGKRIARISSFTIRTVQNAILTKMSLATVLDELMMKLVPRPIKI